MSDRRATLIQTQLNELRDKVEDALANGLITEEQAKERLVSRLSLGRWLHRVPVRPSGWLSQRTSREK